MINSPYTKSLVNDPPVLEKLHPSAHVVAMAASLSDQTRSAAPCSARMALCAERNLSEDARRERVLAEAKDATRLRVMTRTRENMVADGKRGCSVKKVRASKGSEQKEGRRLCESKSTRVKGSVAKAHQNRFHMEMLS